MRVADEDAHDARPEVATGTAVLLLAGSSGRVEADRAELLAAHGAHVRAIRWFGGRDQRPAPHEVPIELFADELDRLHADADRVALFGTSFGAEAALVTAASTKVDATVAVAPSSVVWGGSLDGSWSSHWTRGGAPLPFAPFDPEWAPDSDPPAFRGLYERSLARDPAAAARAAIPVERIDGALVLVVGGDDRVWPSDRFAADIRDRRTRAGRETEIIAHPHAGHRLVLPGESPPVGGHRMERGGDDASDRALGETAWPVVRRVLGLR